MEIVKKGEKYMYKSRVKKRETHARAHKAQREKKISVCEKMVNLLNFLFECSLKQLN